MLQFLFEYGSTIVYCAIGILSLLFLYQYVFAAYKNNSELNNVISQIKSKGEIDANRRKDDFNAIFKVTSLSHHWFEYQETLHDQYRVTDGEYVLDKTRATITAAAFFSQQNIIDSKINTELYKHLPGVLTGLGIIGTFIGLLYGLNHFEISDPTKIEQSVTGLLSAVEHAFYASATAIFVAMFVTVLEKYLLNKAVVLLDELVQLIDKQFIAGIGEEYLSDLVKNSQESAVQTKQLKDSLVNDLKTMLENMVAEQGRQTNSLAEKLIESNLSSAELTAKQISESVENVFREPLQKIAETVRATSQDQSSQVQSLLADVLTEFHQKLEENFGKQFKGLGEMLERSTESIASMQNGFADLIGELKTTSRDTSQEIQQALASTINDISDSQSLIQESIQKMLVNLEDSSSRIANKNEDSLLEMNSQMSKMLDQIDQRQIIMSDKFNEFVDATQQNLERTSKEAINSVVESISGIDDSFKSVFDAFSNAQDEMSKKSQESQNKLHEQTISIIDGVNDKVGRLVETINEQQVASKETIQLLYQNTEQTLSKINESVISIDKASQHFTKAAEGLSDASNDFEDMLHSIAESSKEFATASQQVSKLITDYGNHRVHLEGVLQKFNEIHKSFSAEADARAQMTESLESLSEEISESVDEMKSFMNQYESLMASSFQKFGDGVGSSLNKVLQDLDKGLTTVVSELKANFEDLSESIEDLAETASSSLKK